MKSAWNWSLLVNVQNGGDFIYWSRLWITIASGKYYNTHKKAHVTIRAQIPFFSSGIQPTAMELATIKERTIDTETDLHTQKPMYLFAGRHNFFFA